MVLKTAQVAICVLRDLFLLSNRCAYVFKQDQLKQKDMERQLDDIRTILGGPRNLIAYPPILFQVFTLR